MRKNFEQEEFLFVLYTTGKFQMAANINLNCCDPYIISNLTNHQMYNHLPQSRSIFRAYLVPLDVNILTKNRSIKFEIGQVLHQIYWVMSCHQYLDTNQVSCLSDDYNRKRHFTSARP